jgi:hexosaminidase
MADLFPDPYIHIGGDENNGVQWNANPRIQAFIREHGLKNKAGLHAYFNRRVRDILAKYGKKMLGWDEILHPDLPKDSVIQSWRGPQGLADAAKQGYHVILSNGYYIDLCHSAAEHYRNDPIPAETKLTTNEQSLILGGEATMWAEWVTPETIDSRIWPRTAAIAERLWSPRDVNSLADMCRRLAVVSRRLEETGLLQDKNRGAMIRRFAGDGASEELLRSLAVLIGAIEPVKDYNRSKEQPESTQFTPLTGLADCARPESDTARQFRSDMETLLHGTADEASAAAEAMRNLLGRWQAAGDYIATSHEGSPRVTSDAVPVAAALADTAAIGLAALRDLEANRPVDDTWRTAALARLDTDAKVHAAVELPMIVAIRQLLTAAAPSKTP